MARAFLLLGDGFPAPSGRFCQQMCEIPCFNAVFTGFFLDRSSLPPDFARGFAQSRALALTRYVHFLFGDHSSLPPDFARRFVQS